MKIKTAVLVISISLLLISNHLFGAQLSAEVDRQQVHLGETLQLTIHLVDSSSTNQPKFDNLHKNFKVASTSTSLSNISFNGVNRSSRSWILVLEPKDIGDFTIPSLSIDHLQTQPIAIHVVEPQKYDPNDTTQHENIFMQATLEPTNPYVKAEAIYVLKLFYNRTIQKPKFTEPKAAESTIYLLGKEKTYQQRVAEESYQVIEQRYAIIPSKAGKIKINGPTLSGQARQQLTSQQGFYTSRWQSFSIAANDVTMSVKPAQTIIDPWLPAKSLEITSEWSPNQNSIPVGEPITLSVTLSAIGITGEQLPSLSQWDIPSTQVYNDKAEVTTDSDGEHLWGQRIEKIAFLAQQPGILTIPERKINWWNTKTNTLETAIVPAKTFTISATASDFFKDITNPHEVARNNSVIFPWYTNIWLWVAVGMGLFCIFIILFYQRQLNDLNSSRSILKDAPQKANNQKQAWQQVKQACDANLPIQAAKALLSAAKLQWPEQQIVNIHDLNTILSDKTFREQLTKLEQLVYKDASLGWDGKEFYQCLEKVRAINSRSDDTSNHSNSRLSRLYPE